MRHLLRQMFEAAIASAQADRVLPAYLPSPREVRGRLIVIGAGKASAAMAQAVEAHWQGPPESLQGLVTTRYGHGAACRRITVLEASHPVPDAAGEAAARRTLASVQGLSAEDVVLCLMSGGGSALWPLPLGGLTLAELQALHQALLASGASIQEMNCVRRHLSALHGGRLAAACAPARVITLLISDVPGDEPADIASGPTVADASTCAEALAVLERYALAVPPEARRLLESGAGETLKPGDPRLARAEHHLVATPQLALEAAASVARRAGFTPVILGDALEGEAREVGKVLAAIALQARRHQQPVAPPCVLLSGGETTVTLRGESLGGRGGRNVECLLSLALALRGAEGIAALCGDTDGVDGQEEVAGAVIGPDTLARARALGLSPREELERHNAHGFFEALGDQVVTGPTRTNVNDFRAIAITPS